MKKIIALGLCLIGALSIGFSVYGGKQAGIVTPPPIFVTTQQVHQKPWQNKVSATGALSTFDGTTLKAETSGRIVKILFKPGTYVTAGTPLAEIYPDIIKGQLEKAEAELKLSQINYERYLKLYRKGFFTKIDLDRSFTLIQSNQGEVDQLKAQLVQTLIRAPFDGLLGLDQVSMGGYVKPGQSIVNLQKLDPIRVEFYLPETVLSELGPADKIEMRTPAFPDQVFTGKIYAKESLVDASSRQLAARARIPNEKHQLLPGLFGQVTVFLGEPKSVIIIPQSAIVYSSTEAYVYRVINQKAVKTLITTGGKLENSEIIVLQGLHENDVLVTEGQLKLKDGSAVSLYSEQNKTAKS